MGGPSKGPGRRAPVFYNPGMALDRDLEVALLNALVARGEAPTRGWEMTAATGVRGLRLRHESGAPKELLLTELRGPAYDVLRRNVDELGEPGVRAERQDARSVPPGAPFDLVDLDPYGSPLPFLDASLDALELGGLLAVTATDMIVLAGAQRGIAERRYGGRPVPGRLGPESGLRLLLAALARGARARGRSIRPRLAYVQGHHVRAYASVGPASSDPDPVAEVGGPEWQGPALPNRGPFGPMWTGALFDAELVGALQVPDSAARPSELAPFLERIRAEAVVSVPFFYEPNTLARSLRLPRPPALARMLARLRADDWLAERSHTREAAFRTTAPRAAVEAAARTLAG